LHDVLEDTDITELKLEESMGKEVTAIVNACSSKKFGEPKEDDPWLSKKRYLERLLKKSKDDPSLLVALADKVHNSESCVNEYPTDPTSRVDYWKKFTSGYEKQKEWYEGLNAGLKSKGTLPPALLNRLDTAIKILFY
jgi:(p)ppGpp synthase/HD superfamily hydrolase